MPLYGVSVDALDEHMKSEFPSHIQVWYANNFYATSKGRAVRPLIKRIGEIEPSRAVFQEPTKSHISDRNGFQRPPQNSPPWIPP